MTKKQTFKTNVLAEQYICNYTNYALSIDITQLGQNGYCFIAMDIATRAIAGHVYKNTPLDTQDILSCLEATIEARRFLPDIQIIHSDRESYFKNEAYFSFLNKQNIKPSRGSSSGRNNQIIERTNRTFKNILRRSLQPLWREGRPNDPLQQKHPVNVINKLVKEAIQAYNNKPHKTLHKLSPNAMEEALFDYLHQKGGLPTIQTQEDPLGNITKREFTIEGQTVQVLAKNQPGPELEGVNEFRHKVVAEYAGDWAKFFVEFRAGTEKSFEQIKQQNNSLYQQNLKLTQMNSEMKKTLDYVKGELEIQENKRNLLEERRLKRNKAKKAPQRESISLEEFKSMLNHRSLQKRSYGARRKKAALLLLYITGLRISNLLNFSVKNMQQMLDKGSTKVDIIKKGEAQKEITISRLGRELIQQKYEDFSVLMNNKTNDDPLFTTQKVLNKPIHKTSLDKEVNEFLKTASLEQGKHFRSHSFRATLISDLLESQPLQRVARLIGHNQIGTTALYDREKLTKEQMVDVLHALDTSRISRGKKKEEEGKKNSKAQEKETKATIKKTARGLLA